MREFVVKISVRSKERASGSFFIIPQNGQEIITDDGTAESSPDSAYLAAISGQGREDLFYGYEEDDTATPESESEEILPVLQIARGNGKLVLVTDYCSTITKVDDSFNRNDAAGFVGFAANDRELASIPTYPVTAHNESAEREVSSLSLAQNFLYLINPDGFESRADYIASLAATDYDVFIIDSFYDETILTSAEVSQLQRKGGGSGGRRIVLSYVSIGEAEDYRWYWKSVWRIFKPRFLMGENSDWKGNFSVRYWKEAWQDIVFKYADMVVDAGFDGLYLDKIDIFEFFEDNCAAYKPWMC